MKAADLRLELMTYEQMSPGKPFYWRTSNKLLIDPLPGETMEFIISRTTDVEGFYLGTTNIHERVTFANSFVEIEGLDYILRRGVDYTVEHYDRAIFFRKPVPAGKKIKITYDPSGALEKERRAHEKGHNEFKAGDIANLVLLYQNTNNHVFPDEVMRQLAAEMVGQYITSEKVLNEEMREKMLPNTPLRILKAEFKNGAIIATAELV